MTTTTTLRQKWTQHVAQARAIQDAFGEGKQMPAEAAHQMRQHLDAAEGYKARLTLADAPLSDREAERHYGHPGMSIDDLDGPGRVPASDGKVAMLTPEQKVADWRPDTPDPEFGPMSGKQLDPEAAYGLLGILGKSQFAPVSGREIEKWARAVGVESKDVTTSTGGALIPSPLAAFLIDAARAATVVIRLGARTVPMGSRTLSVPRLDADPTPQWLAEGATVTASDPTLSSLLLTSQRLDCRTNATIEALEDSNPVALGETLANSIAKAFALKVDAAALRGSGVAPEPAGIRNTSGVQTYANAANGDPLTYSLLMTLASLVAGVNQTPTGAVVATRSAFALGSQVDNVGQPVRPPAYLDNISILDTTSLPLNITKGTLATGTEAYVGAWDQLYIGTRVGFMLQRADEILRADDKVSFFARTRLAIGVTRGNAFAVATAVSN